MHHRPINRMRPMLLGTAIGAAGLLGAACSSSSSPGTSSTSSPTTRANAPAASVSTVPHSEAGSTVSVSSSATYGRILVDSTGMALYTYSGDHGHGGQSTCTGACLQAWPALTVAAGSAPTGGTGVTGTLAAVKQANGTYQVTYNGLPLYTFVQDSGSEVTGNGVNGFSVATVGGASSSGATTGATSTTAHGSGGNGY